MAILKPCLNAPIKLHLSLDYLQACSKVMSASITPAKILKHIPMISVGKDRMMTHHAILVTKVHRKQIYLNNYNTNLVLTNSLTAVLDDLMSEDNRIYLKIGCNVYMVKK
nr:TPA_asm: 22 kDa protein [Lepidozia ophiovirus_sela]